MAAQRGARARERGPGGSRTWGEGRRGVRGGGAASVWLRERGASMGAGSPFGMITRAVQGAAGLSDGERIEVRRQKLCARVARHVAPSERARLSEFLGELTGVRFDDKDRVQLRAARQDAML